MSAYLIVKTLHILSATLMVGTGFGTAFYLFWANRSGSLEAQSVVSRWVVKADWWFTTPTVIFQLASGSWMIWKAGWAWDTKWIVRTLALYALCGAAAEGLAWLLLGAPPDMTALVNLSQEKLADPATLEQAHAAMRYNLGHLLLFAPLSLAFWHAPALTHWHGVPPVKSLFFSAVAVLRNWRAFTLYGLAAAALMASATLALTLLVLLLGAPALAAHGVALLGLVMAAIFSASVWFSFCGCFEDAPPEQG